MSRSGKASRENTESGLTRGEPGWGARWTAVTRVAGRRLERGLRLLHVSAGLGGPRRREPLEDTVERGSGAETGAKGSVGQHVPSSPWAATGLLGGGMAKGPQGRPSR